MKKILTLVTLVLGIYCAQAQTNEGAFASKKLGEPVMSDIAAPLIKTKADASSFAGGSGTEADPFLIATKEHLSSLAALSFDNSGTSSQKLKGVYFKQIADIVFEKDDPTIYIGNGAWFSGTYDGDGYAIKNYTVKYNTKNATNGGLALFMNCTEATLKNIRMIGTNIDIDVEGSDYFMLAAGLAGNYINGKIVNCTTEGSYNMRVGGTQPGALIGGLVSYLANSTIDNCRTYGNYRNELVVEKGTECYTEMAGIAAEIIDSKVINCISYGKAENIGSGNADGLNVRTAGIAAFTNGSQVLNSCSRGESLVSVGNNKQQDGTSYVFTAGLVAVMNGKSLLSKSWNVVPMLKSEGSTELTEPNPVCVMSAGESTISNCYYMLEGEENEAAMKNQKFVDELNKNLPEGALAWQLRKDDFPALQALHNVTLPLLTGAATTPGGGISEIEDGERFRFTLALDKDYSESKPVVTVGDKTLVPDAGMNYITDPVTADMAIKIDGIVKNTATANEEITTGSKVYAAGGVLYIQPEAPVKVSVFNMQGRLMESSMISGDTQMQLPQGIYVVRLGDRNYKVSISE